MLHSSTVFPCFWSQSCRIVYQNVCRVSRQMFPDVRELSDTYGYFSLVIMPTKRKAWCTIFLTLRLRCLISFNFLSWSGNKKRMLRLTWPLSSWSCSLNVYVGNSIFRIIWLTPQFYLRGISDGLHRYAFYAETESSWLGWFLTFLVWNFDWNYLKITVTTNNCSNLSDP